MHHMWAVTSCAINITNYNYLSICLFQNRYGFVYQIKALNNVFLTIIIFTNTNALSTVHL